MTCMSAIILNKRSGYYQKSFVTGGKNMGGGRGFESLVNEESIRGYQSKTTFQNSDSKKF